MFDDLDRSLERLLKQNLQSELLRSVNISFDTPDSTFPPSWIKLPAINLFLYNAHANLELRNTEWTWERNDNDSGIIKKPPVQVECSYIITAWTSENTPNHMLEEHRLLGATMKALLKDRIFPKELLHGSLKDNTATIIKTLALQADNARISEFWQAMGTKLRLAINYQVTVSIDVHAPEKVKEVKDRKFKFFDVSAPGNMVEEFQLMREEKEPGKDEAA